MYNSQITHDRIMTELQRQNKTAKTMCADLGLGVNAVHQMAHMAMGFRSSTLYAIADYLNVSADYLLGRTDNAESHKL